MPLQLPEISDESVKTLTDDINSKGFGFLVDYISPAELEQMRSFVSSAVRSSGGQYVGFTGRDAVAGSALDEFSNSPVFRDLFRRIYERGTGRAAPKVEFYQVLRCLTGQSGKKHSLNFHFDSYVVTALIPVEIPTEGPSGDLIMLPNARKIRNTYTANVVDKILLDNKLTQVTLKLLTKMRLLPLTRIRMTPGNIYFFWGYRSIHTNEACDPSKVRATALFHYANPHAGSQLSLKMRGPTKH